MLAVSFASSTANYRISVVSVRGLGDVITDDLERANLLNTYFTSMCTEDSKTSQTFDRVAGLPVDSDIETIVFTPGLVNAAIKKLKLGGASGLD
jgi:hypothetical protein